MSSRAMMILAGSAVAVAAVAAVATWTIWGGSPAGPPDPTAHSPNDVAAYMVSEEFAALPEKRQIEYFRQVRKADPNALADLKRVDLPEQQRDKLLKTVGRLAWQDVVAEYCELPAAEREAYLDKIIDEKEAGQKKAATAGEAKNAEAAPKKDSGDASTGKRDEGKGKGFSSARLKNWMENVPPEERAQVMEFKRAMQERMEQRRIGSSADPRK